MLQRGETMRDIALCAPRTYIRCHKGLAAIRAALVEPRTSKPFVKVFFGSTGVGKSRRARNEIGTPLYVWHPQCQQWFDGYGGEANVLFEEFRGQLPFGMLLSLLDRYDAKVQYKGGVIEFAATTIYLTSPVHPTQWYSSEKLQKDDCLDQLLRRIDEVEELLPGNQRILQIFAVQQLYFGGWSPKSLYFTLPFVRFFFPHLAMKTRPAYV